MDVRAWTCNRRLPAPTSIGVDLLMAPTDALAISHGMNNSVSCSVSLLYAVARRPSSRSNSDRTQYAFSNGRPCELVTKTGTHAVVQT